MDLPVEQRRRRRWSIFFKLTFVAFITFIIFSFYVGQKEETPQIQKKHTALVNVQGLIFDTAKSNADKISAGLRRAFKDKNTVGIIMRINSPGGSAVQASYIYNEIRRLRKQYPDTKLYAVCVDACASAAYYIASAADEIYANPSSLVGSIGALINGFGFVETLDKLGVERRLFTAGDRKGFLDPFSPLKKEDQQLAQQLLDNTHQHFINDVKQGRGKRLADDPDMFSGLIWDGSRAKELGLIDGFGSTGTVARDIIKNENIVDYTVKPNLIEQISKQFGTATAESFVKQIQMRTQTQGFETIS